MKRKIIGILYGGKSLGKDEKIFLNLGKKKNIGVTLVNTSKRIDKKLLNFLIKKCGVIYNSNAEEYAIEIVKTLEENGKKVFESSKSYYYLEDKWLLYLKCKKHGILVPKTKLISQSMNGIKKELREFGSWPIILKGVFGTMGEYVQKANNLDEAEKIIRKFWKKTIEKIPIIAQEFIPSPSYRVLLINKKICQTVLKENKHGWKATGVYAKTFEKFEIDESLNELLKKLMKFINIKVCGVDLLKKDNKWYLLEINGQPELGFFEEEREKMIERVFNFLEKELKKIN